MATSGVELRQAVLPVIEQVWDEHMKRCTPRPGGKQRYMRAARRMVADLGRLGEQEELVCSEHAD